MKQTFLISFLLIITNIAAVSQEVSVRALTSVRTPNSVIQFEYNRKGQVVAEKKEVFDNASLNYSFEYEYDEFGNIYLLKKQDANFYHQEENIYNDNNQMVVKKIFEDYGAGLKFIAQNLYNYQEGLLDTVICQSVYNNGEQIFNNTKQVFTYKGKDITVNKYDWVMGNWIYSEIFNYEHNEYDELIHYANETLVGEDFMKMWRYVFHYNDNREITERTHYFGAGDDWNERPADKYLYYYETVTKNEDIVYPNIYQFDELNFNWFHPDHVLLKYDYWLSDCGGTLHFEETADYIYEMITIDQDPEDGIKNIDKEDVMIYPNPTTGELRILMNNEQLIMNNIEVFDVFGRKLSSNHLIPTSSNHLINISHLPAGTYFVQITTDSGKITKKIIKK